MSAKTGYVYAMLWAYSLVETMRLTGAYYHLTSPQSACQMATEENATVDLICQHHDHSQIGRPCTVRSIQWQRLEVGITSNITDSVKYGIWEAIPGWGMEEGEHVSLLRIRDVQMEDMARYRCRVECESNDWRLRNSYNMADLCMRQPNKNYAICGTEVRTNRCSHAFWNGICDPDCDDEDNLYDGLDCSDEPDDCSHNYDDACRRSFANGVCDLNCNSPGCAWDGGDCIDKPLKFAEDTVVLTLARWYARTYKTVDMKHLGRTLSSLLHTVVRVLPADWSGEHTVTAASIRPGEASWHKPNRLGHVATRQIFIKLDNTNCIQRCFHQAESAARYISMALRNGWDPDIPIASVGVLSHIDQRCRLENNTMLEINLATSADGEENIYYTSYTREQNRGGTPLWMLVAAVAGGVCILVLVIAIVFILLRIKKLRNEDRSARQNEVNRIQFDKNSPQGTDV